MARTFKKNNNKWIPFDKDPEVKFKLKPFSLLYLTKMPSEELSTPETLWEIFVNTILDWEGILDENDNPIPCTTENKRIVAENDEELLLFVVNEASKLKQELKEKEIKN